MKLTMDLLKSLRRDLTVLKNLVCRIAACSKEVKSFALLLQSTIQRSELVETTKTYRSKINQTAE